MREHHVYHPLTEQKYSNLNTTVPKAVRVATRRQGEEVDADLDM